MEDLDRELRALGATSVSLQVDTSDRDFRIDGQLRADAKIRHPGVILTIETKKHGTLIYSTDRYIGVNRYVGGSYNKQPGWQANLRAIALGLEALRKVERYGIAERGQQYAGYRELPPAAIVLSSRMTVEMAAEFILEHRGIEDWADGVEEAQSVEDDPLNALHLYTKAAKVLHPDVGGDVALFQRLQQARKVLEEAGGRAGVGA